MREYGPIQGDDVTEMGGHDWLSHMDSHDKRELAQKLFSCLSNFLIFKKIEITYLNNNYFIDALFAFYHWTYLCN